MANGPVDVDRANRWFAVEFNNRAWDLVEKHDRSPDETERMIQLAHAACIHWLEVGNIVNQVRAQCLLATAYAAAGLGELAIRHAEKCLALSNEAGSQLTAFDRASAYGAASNAYQRGGDVTCAREYYQQAMTVAAALNADEQRAFHSLYTAP